MVTPALTLGESHVLFEVLKDYSAPKQGYEVFMGAVRKLREAKEQTQEEQCKNPAK